MLSGAGLFGVGANSAAARAGRQNQLKLSLISLIRREADLNSSVPGIGQ